MFCVQLGRVTTAKEMLNDGTWIIAVEDEHILNIIKENPESVMDGAFFSQSYKDVGFDDLKQESLDTICFALADAMMIKTASERGGSPEKLMLLRTNSSLQWLTEKRVV